MPDKILNRIAKSPLITIDLEDFYPQGERLILDIKDWLTEGLVLHEKVFRAQLTAHNWQIYQNTYVALTCSSDAIIPAWAYMLVSVHLQAFAKKIVIGTLDSLETCLYQEIIEAIDTTKYAGKPVIIKGCANKFIPQNAYIMLIEKITPVARSIMYGEACSSVPLYKYSDNQTTNFL